MPQRSNQNWKLMGKLEYRLTKPVITSTDKTLLKKLDKMDNSGDEQDDSEDEQGGCVPLSTLWAEDLEIDNSGEEQDDSDGSCQLINPLFPCVMIGVLLMKFVLVLFFL